MHISLFLSNFALRNWKRVIYTLIFGIKKMVNSKNTKKANIPYEDQRKVLEEWMDKKKPYLRQNFRIEDLRAALPLNRTYLSRLINNEYHCSFFHFVARYRVEEAKRLMATNPNLMLQEVAAQAGFASSTVFGRVFARETGMTPSAWRRTNK